MVTKVLVTVGVAVGGTLLSPRMLHRGGTGTGSGSGSAPGPLQLVALLLLLPSLACGLQLEDRHVDCSTPLCRPTGAVAAAPLYQLLLRRVVPVPRRPSPLTARAHSVLKN